MPDETIRGQGGRFLPGQAPRSPGRPKGARSKLGEAFLTAILADFETHGVAAIQRVRADDPAAYVRTIASILPKELTGEDGEALFSGITVNFVRAGDKPKL